jgi:hypothetical protein
LAFLVVTSAKGTTWKFSILGKALEQFSYPLLLVIRLFMVAVVGILSTWLSERWVLRDADACSADTVSGLAGRVLYSFRDRSGEYYGGECFPFALESSKLGRLVFYNLRKPHLNKIMMGCLFHRVLIVGRGLTELDEQTVASRIRQAQPAAQGG